MLSLAMAIIGVGLVVQSVVAHGGVALARLLVGLLFIAAGAGRSYIELRRGQRGGRSPRP